VRGNAQVNLDPLEVEQIPCISSYALEALKEKLEVLNRVLKK